ncbi:hypothetical protein AMS68_002975 [Peltaster fructicola]|uniref:Mitochondrial resolvase Ydc2 catalytic domain-containing protein n=1 Tax=Peltaster fructicola TaxID=286661 RepID=A0A6H0XS56_9PEZI|nr:hypothetical protein AMS68_002975 [Peltaster fructicola]
MGIRNLAYCVMKAAPLARTSKANFNDTVLLEIDTWRKVDLTQQLKPQEEAETAATAPAGEVAIGRGLFTPAKVSKLAYTVSKQFLHHKPDVILIEEQRHRSSGGSAIQEWTIRVNMLESMLWACLETMKHEAAFNETSFPSIYSVSPAKVARFWYAGNTIELSPTLSLLDGGCAIEEPPGRTKITKKDRIAVLQNWLNTTDNKDVSLKFAGEAQATAQRFMTSEGRRRGVAASEKLDDLTDCLLQGAAWIKWQKNISDLSDMLATKDV